MNVQHLIRELQKYDNDAIVVISDPDKLGWSNIEIVLQKEEESSIRIVISNNELFQN